LISPIVNDFNEITNFIKISEDITEKKRIYEEIIQAKQKAEESERLKTAFLQNMSHEIRTPLNGVIGFSNLLSTKDLSKSDISEYSSIIQTSAKRLLEIVNNILDISKIETGQIKIVQGEFSINTLIRNIYSIFSLIAKEKELEFNYSVALDDISSVIYSDETKIHQILSNLVNNALKFTKTGSVNFGYNVEDENLIFYVKDTGIGIPEDMQTKIFERFIQADMGLTRNFEGAGLGLAICNGLANLLGGKIWLESEIGKGSTFYFSIPFNQIKNQSNLYSEKEEKIEMLTNKKILIVEDDFTSYLYLRILLDDIGVPTLYASDGTEALEIIKNNNDIALILMDIRMPKMNGIDATKEIKSTYPDLPIIAQTAYAYSEEKEKVLALGCDDYLSKPIDKNLLYKTIKKYIN
jgi:CheY-like chemotaxis protein/nitrogen-specific signal transduction histidine kinase